MGENIPSARQVLAGQRQGGAAVGGPRQWLARSATRVPEQQVEGGVSLREARVTAPRTCGAGWTREAAEVQGRRSGGRGCPPRPGAAGRRAVRSGRPAGGGVAQEYVAAQEGMDTARRGGTRLRELGLSGQCACGRGLTARAEAMLQPVAATV